MRKEVLAKKREELQQQLEMWAADPAARIKLARGEVIVVTIGIQKLPAPRVQVLHQQKWHEELGTKIPRNVWKQLFAVHWGSGRKKMFQAFYDNRNQPMTASEMVAHRIGERSYFSSGDREQTNSSLRKHGIPLRVKSPQHGGPYESKPFQLILVRDLSAKT